MIQAIKKEEAKNKSCPFTFGIDPHLMATSDYACIADQCMAWVPCVTIDDKPEKGTCGMIRRQE
jgi:hypothetical protein